MRRFLSEGRLKRQMERDLGQRARRFASYLTIATLGALATAASAQVSAGGRFDLAGPRIDVHVQRGDQSLPIAMVPNLQAGDKLTLHADLPSTQSVKLILVVAFLRGSTNPPPEDWFTKVNTWDKKVRAEGVVVTVPKEAQQALVFLAPETGGDYSTLKSAVTGRPGVFVRAAQDLNEASFEQARIERYLQAIRRVPAGSSAELLDHSRKLAATLNLKPNEDCFKKEPDQQLSCLRQTGTQVLLDDGHGQTLASMIANGDSANLIGAVAGTPMANTGGVGAYSAYVGTIIDVVRLMSGLHTAQFQYIPAIAFPDEETLNLRLNTPPSFHNPKSVIVVALPAIQASVAPPLRLQDPAHVSCLLQPAMVLPLEGAPLVFATGFAHDLVLHLNGATLNGKTELPLVPDAYEGGLILSDKPERKPLAVAAPEARDADGKPVPTPTPTQSSKSPTEGKATAGSPAGKPATSKDTPPAMVASDDNTVQITGTLRGAWGFDSFVGVTVPLQRRPGGDWTVARSSDLYAGRSNQLVLHADGTACTSKIELDVPGADSQSLSWKQAGGPPKPGTDRGLDVKLPLEKAAPGKLSLLVHQFGTGAVTKVAVTAYSDATRLQVLQIHAGDSFGTLSGSGLRDVRQVKLGDVVYTPTPDQPADTKELRLASNAVTKSGAKSEAVTKSPLGTAGQTGTAEAILNDGRSIPVRYTVDAARPTVTILNKSIRPDGTGSLPLTLGNKDDLPLNARITIALRSESPARFPRSEKVEVALADGTLHTTLSFSDGSLILQDAHTALAFLPAAKAFGASAFGPIQLRPVADDGTVGDWVPLGTLVRTPAITGVTCTRGVPRPTAASPDPTEPAAQPDTGCSITGSNLFLIDSISADSSFSTPMTVPLGFAGDSLPVPRPADNRTLYLKLRDDPESIVTVVSPAPVTAASRRAAPAPAPSAAPTTSAAAPSTTP